MTTTTPPPVCVFCGETLDGYQTFCPHCDHIQPDEDTAPLVLDNGDSTSALDEQGDAAATDTSGVQPLASAAGALVAPGSFNSMG